MVPLYTHTEPFNSCFANMALLNEWYGVTDYGEWKCFGATFIIRQASYISSALA